MKEAIFYSCQLITEGGDRLFSNTSKGSGGKRNGGDGGMRRRREGELRCEQFGFPVWSLVNILTTIYMQTVGMLVSEGMVVFTPWPKFKFKHSGVAFFRSDLGERYVCM